MIEILTEWLNDKLTELIRYCLKCQLIVNCFNLSLEQLTRCCCINRQNCVLKQWIVKPCNRNNSEDCFGQSLLRWLLWWFFRSFPFLHDILSLIGVTFLYLCYIFCRLINSINHLAGSTIDRRSMTTLRRFDSTNSTQQKVAALFCIVKLFHFIVFSILLRVLFSYFIILL